MTQEQKIEAAMIKGAEKIVSQLEKAELKAILRSYRAINNLLFELIEEMHKSKIPVPKWQEYFEIHLTKFALMNSSLIKEFEGVKLKISKGRKPQTTNNISALNLLNRGLMETFFIIKYLYFNYKTDSQGAFRTQLYKYSGLTQRQTFPAVLEENKRAKAAEKLELDQIEAEIQKNTYFLSLPEWKRKSIFNRKDAKELGWKEIIQECNINKDFHHRNWQFLSNYAHSEQVEAMQLISIFTAPNQIRHTTFIILQNSIIWPAMLIMDLVKKYPKLGTIADRHPFQLAVATRFWDALGRKMKPLEEPKEA